MNKFKVVHRRNGSVVGHKFFVAGDRENEKEQVARAICEYLLDSSVLGPFFGDTIKVARVEEHVE